MQGVNAGSQDTTPRPGWHVHVQGGVLSDLGTHTVDLVADESDLTLAFVKVMARLLSVLTAASDQRIGNGCALTSCELEVRKWA